MPSSMKARYFLRCEDCSAETKTVVDKNVKIRVRRKGILMVVVGKR
jgi:hypothetical protein